MQFGHFDDPAREYVITNPRTPVRWINYVGTLEFGGFVDQTGGGVICRGDPALNRIVKYIAQLPASQFNGETLYLRFKQDDRYQVFSPYFVPTLDPYDRYECHVGLGYTRIVSEFCGIRTDATIFVPLGAHCVLRDIKLTNLTDKHVELDAVPVVEYTHPDSLKQLTNADWVPQTMVSRSFEGENGTTILAQYPFMNRDRQINYFTTNLPASSFETDRRRFLGDNEYGTWQDPQSLRFDELSNYQANRGDNIAALMHHLMLGPGETKQLITQLGQAASLTQARADNYRDAAKVECAFTDLQRFWEGYLNRLQVQTPDADMTRMLNIHNPRQCYITKQWSRYLSLYQLGYGARGIGFRDSSQDVMAILAGAPDEARILIEKLLGVQKPNGAAMHQFNPLTMVATEGESIERDDLPHYYGDDHLWIILAVCAYLKETGDLAFLDQVIPFYGSTESGSVLNHMQRAIDFTWNDVGAHGLPLLGFADWNDTVNLRAGAESVFTAALFGKALLEMVELADYRGDNESAEQYRACHSAMRRRVNKFGWDGAWFVRYFDYDGTPLGSEQNAHGQIYVNAQAWPVIAEYATPERARAALDAVHQRLNTRNGIKLSTPGFDGYDPARGGITTYPPGAKENGGIFLHANPWVMIAETLVGNGDRAFEYYSQINPSAKNDHIEEYECEPYVYPQNILGDEHPQFGLARNSWLSGTASWVYQAATQYILGIRPTLRGLQIDPCIPRRWDGFRATREFRGALYDIQVENPAHVSRGVQSVQVDGKEMGGDPLPVFASGTHPVCVVMSER